MSVRTGDTGPEIAVNKPQESSRKSRLTEPLFYVKDSLEAFSDSNAVPYDILKVVKDKVDLFLFYRWHAIIHLNAVHVIFVSAQNNVTVQRSVEFSASGDVKLFVHCEPVDIQPFLVNVPDRMPLTYASVNDFVDRMTKIVNNVRQMEVCSGVDNKDLKAGWQTCSLGEIDKNPYKECRFSETFRSFTCSRLVKRNAWRCSECLKVVPPLTRRAHSASLDPNPNTANIHLTEEQKLQKLQEQRRKLENARKKISRLEEKMAQLLNKEGVSIDKELSDDLTEILLSHKISPAQSIFLQQQIKASQRTKSKGQGNRWHPVLVRLAISLHITSPTAYELLRDSGMIKLPSSRTLFDYEKVKPPKEGIDEVTMDAAANRIKKLKHMWQKYHVLMGDEMSISQNVMFQKSSGAMIGFTSLDKVDQEVQNLEAYLNDVDETDREPVIAQKVMVYMIKGVSSGIKAVVATYAVASITANQMYYWTWRVIGSLERRGIAIIAFVSDGCSVNRAFIKKHTPVTVLKSGVVFDTINKSAPSRVLYFVSDVPHLLKTIRNCLYSSRAKNKKDKRCMRRNGKKITWDPIIKLYEAKKTKNLRKSFKLNAMNVYPDSYARMKVKYAAEILSRTVAQDLEDQGWDDASELIFFMRFVNDWFDCLNGAHSFVGKRKRNERLDTYTSVDDKRFDFILSFCEYLEKWEEDPTTTLDESALKTSALDESEENNSIDIDEALGQNQENETVASKRVLSRQTLEGIEMSSRAFIPMVKFLLAEGTEFINARIFTQDPLEQYFSRLRAGQGGSNNPNVSQVLSRNRALHVVGQMGFKRRRGNAREIESTVDLSGAPLEKRRRTR